MRTLIVCRARLSAIDDVSFRETAWNNKRSWEEDDAHAKSIIVSGSRETPSDVEYESKC